MKKAVIKNNIVENIIKVDDDFFELPGCLLVDVTERQVGKGWSYDSATGTFIKPIPPLDQAVSMKCIEVDALRDEKIADGVSYDFPDGTRGTIQTRNETDIRNVQGNGNQAFVHVVQDAPNTEMVFRDEQNVTHTLTATQMLTMAQTVAAHIQALYSAAWTHKDAIRALNTVADVRAYDITTGWG